MKMYLAPHRHRHIRTNPVNRYHGMPTCDVHVPLNVKMEKNSYIIEAVIPGLKSEDIAIEIVEDVVDIQGEFPQIEEEDVKYLRQERPTGKFRRRVKLPTLLNVKEANATLEEGILYLRVPKAEEALPRTIEVKAK
ncbi:MAG: 18 kDa heat shock protein [Chloroflexi bacterium]|nr:18 kDa heat shock protein [Chloroflexota bacterium]